ncbi:MAG: MATE family efflux transporter [Oscillospiraceae bacterium]|nr:MATE family efflux transporter [Oscillospiraceae bacterium]
MAKDMTKGTPWKLILIFFAPTLAGNLFQQLYSMVDTIIVGRFISVEALAAVGATGFISFLVLGFAIGLTGGFSVITAQRFGSGDEEGVRRSVAVCILLSVIFTVVLTALSTATTMPLLRLLNTPDNIIQDAADYINVIYLGIVATMYYNMIAGILRALGDSKTPLYFLILSSLVNVGLDLVFIINLDMGVAGAAWATVLSQLISAVLCTLWCAKKYPILHLKRENFRVDWQFVCSHLNVGVPMAFQFSVTAVGCLVLQSAINVFGSDVIASFTAAGKVENLVTQPLGTMGTTMAVYCGQNLGAGRIDRIRKGLRDSMIMSMIFSVAGAAINFFWGGAVTGLFMDQPTAQIIGYAQQYLNTIAVFFPFLAVLYIYRNALQSMGESFVPLMGGVGEFLARLAAALILPGLIGYAGICLASPLAWIAAAVPLTAKYLAMLKKGQLQKLYERSRLPGEE